MTTKPATADPLVEWNPRELFRCIVPEGGQGSVSIERFHVGDTASMFTQIRAIHGGARDYVPPGDYTRLIVDGGLMMSDTLAEYNDHREVIRQAHGDVLIHGLGLGCILNVLRRKPTVKSITVVEINADVIALVGPTFASDPRVTIVHDNALTWEPPRGRRWDFVWHDIWPNICADNLPEMHKLHRRFGRRSWEQASWCRFETERAARW